MLSVIESVNAAVNNFIWGVPAMICIIGVGLLFKYPHEFSPDSEISLCHQGYYRTYASEKRSFRWKSDTVSGCLYGVSCYRGNGKYCRCGRCYCHRRTGSRILDVDFRTSWNVYEVFRGYTRCTFPRNQCQRRSGWRTNVLH